MARSGKTAQEFIQSSFSPIVAVLCSAKVENVVSKNNLTFMELLLPFSTMDFEGQFREPGGSMCIVKNWKLIIRDINWKPLQPTEARRQLNNAVLHNYNDKTVSLDIESQKFDVPQSTPWFDAWRETYLEVQFPSDHEYTKHFVSCIIVGTTLDDNIIDTYNALNQQYAQLQNVTPPKLPKWFNNEILKSYLLLHDMSTATKEKADLQFETLKQTFGTSNCFMLCINSKSTVDPCLPTDYWSPFIKRTSESNSEVMSASQISTPLEPQASFPGTNINLKVEENILTASTNPEGLHPLISSEIDVYDNANSLQTHSFSGSSESVSVSGKLLDYSTEIHGAALNSNDVENMKKFLQEYASKALLPHLEKQINQLAEGVTTRKGVSRSLISATKRWFNTGKGGNTTVNNTVIYSSDCPELQLRRLGDLWFMCGQWQRAFEAYHTAKREFYADSAWLCYAGALEMAALSAFMAGEANRKTYGYMEESIVTYLNTCRMVQYAVRATLLSVLCLASSGLHGEAAKQLIRMTSEDSDLRSAMLLEQASLCFLSGPGSKSMCRKYAFHMVLAGHRFSKSGQKKHAYRCYKQAYQVYERTGWRLATDHVQFALGRLAGALRMSRAAARWLRAPLAPHSPQPPHQQRAFLAEYVRAHQQCIEGSEEYRERLPLLPLPLLSVSATAVLCVGPAPLSSPGRVPATSINFHEHGHAQPEPHYWTKMEEMLLQVVNGNVPMIFKPTVDLYTDKTDTNPIVPQGEPIQISLTLQNPLKIGLLLKDVELLWQFVSNSEEDGSSNIIGNEHSIATGSALDGNVICGQKIKSALLEGDSKKILIFTLTPLKVGQLNVQGLAYKLSSVPENGSENGMMTITGKIDLLSGVSNTDKRLQIVVIPHAPCLQMTFSETNMDAISGEMRMVDVEFRNVGPVDTQSLHIAVSHPDCISLMTTDDQDDFKPLYNEKYKKPQVFPDERSSRAAAWRGIASRHVSRVCAGVAGVAGVAGAGVAGGACVRARLAIKPRAPHDALCLLAHYTTPDANRPYRLLRHVFRFRITEAVEVSVAPRRSLRSVDSSVIEFVNLAMEIKNVVSEKNDELVLELLDAYLLSRQWTLTDLTAARNREDPLQAHEKGHLVFKARRILEPLPEGKVKSSRLKISKVPDIAVDANMPPYSKFTLQYEPCYLDVIDPTNQIKASSGLIQSMLIMRWKVTNKSTSHIAVGQHCLWLDCFNKVESRLKERTPIEVPTLQLDEYDSRTDIRNEVKNKTKENVVMLRLEHMNHIKHDFKERKLCLIPITINIVNCYTFPIQVIIDMSKQQSRGPYSALGWCGALSVPEGSGVGSSSVGVGLCVCVSLERLQGARVCVRGVCASPGTYVVGSALAVTARAHPPALNVPPLVRSLPDPTLLLVQQA